LSSTIPDPESDRVGSSPAVDPDLRQTNIGRLLLKAFDRFELRVVAGLRDRGFEDFAARWNPILDVFDEVGVRFALEVHPTEIAFDIVTARRALEAVDHREAFGFNYDPSHLAYQGVDCVDFIHRFGPSIYHAHMKDVWWAPNHTRAGVFGGHLEFGHRDRYWDFRSIGRGSIDFEEIIRTLNSVGYNGPLSIEWEDSGMDREEGAEEACAYIKAVDFTPAHGAFDAAFAKDNQ